MSRSKCQAFRRGPCTFATSVTYVARVNSVDHYTLAHSPQAYFSVRDATSPYPFDNQNPKSEVSGDAYYHRRRMWMLGGGLSTKLRSQLQSSPTALNRAY